VTVGGNQTFSASGADHYGNPVDVSSASWTTTAPGVVSPSIGSSTVFTGSASGGGAVKASIGTVSGSGSVTVTFASTMTVSVTAGTPTKKGPNYHVPLTVTAADSSTSAAIGGANVSLTVYSGSCSSGTIAATGSGTTTSTGQATFNFTTRQTGSWCALASVSATGYNPKTAQTPFSTS
jgi:hypothetical protein